MTPNTNKKLELLSPGEEFTFGGRRWVKLEDIGAYYTSSAEESRDTLRGTLCITKGMVCKKAFDEKNHNDWRKSTLRKWLNGDFLQNIRSAAGFYLDTAPTPFLLMASDLTADDGMTDYGTAEDYIALLSCDQYRKYRAILPAVDDWYWTLTPWTCRASNSHVVRNVYASGTLDINSAYNGSWWVRPLCILQSDIEVSTAEPEPEEETDRGSHLRREYFDADGGSDNAFCSEECAGNALMLESIPNTREE